MTAADKATIRKGNSDPTAPWEVTIPHTGPLVDHVPYADRYDGDDPDTAPLIGPFGLSTWPTFREALGFYADAETDIVDSGTRI